MKCVKLVPVLTYFTAAINKNSLIVLALFLLLFLPIIKPNKNNFIEKSEGLNSTVLKVAFRLATEDSDKDSSTLDPKVW